MIRRIALATAAVTTAALAYGITFSAPAGAVTPVAPLPADQSIPLPLGKFTGMVVDQPAGLVFFAADNPIAADGHGGGVAVSKLDGTGMANIHGTTATAGIALGPDGRIYAAEERGVIAAIDPTTLAVTDHPTGAAANCPTSIAFGDADLWFTFDCGNGTIHNGLAAMDLSTDTVTTVLDASTGGGGERIAPIPSHPDLFAATSFDVGGDVELISVSGTTATVTQSTESLDVQSISVSPDGSTILGTGGALAGAATFSTTDLSRGSITYPGASANTAAFSGDGSSVAVSAGLPGEPDTISTFHAGGTNAIRTYNTSTPGSADQHLTTIPALRGIAWASGSTLLAVYVDYLGGWPLLKVLNSALQVPTTMSFSAPKTATRATRITLTGSINTATAGDQVVITKRDLAGAHTLGTVLTDAKGKFSFADVPAVGSTNTYVARFLGDKSHQTIAASAVTSVSRGTPVLTLKEDTTTYNFRQVARISIHLGSHDVKKVQLWAKPGPQALHYVKTLTVDSKGNVATTNSMVYNTTFVVKFYGDYYYNSRVITSAVKTKAAVAVAVAGNYGTDGAYKLFHAGSKVYQGGSTGPDKSGECLRFEVQGYSGGAWRAGPVLTCGTIQDGVAVAVLEGSPSGVPMRVRTVYSGDSYNLGNSSTYAYFTLR